MSNKDVMTLSVVGLNCFARKVTHEGKECKVVSAGVGDEFERCARFRSLLRSITFSGDISVDMLNNIGFSKSDASELGLDIKGLELINPPPREEWDE